MSGGPDVVDDGEVGRDGVLGPLILKARQFKVKVAVHFEGQCKDIDDGG